MTYLLRFEAADFSNTVFDMPRLSAIRGASMSYLFSPELVSAVLARELGTGAVREVYAGASQGAWTIEAGAEKAVAARRAVEKALARNDLSGEEPTGAHAHLSYTVTLAEGGDAAALAAAEALNAASMLQDAVFPLPAFSSSVSGYDRRGDRARPADPGCTILGELVSQAHWDRHSFGRASRQRFYARADGTHWPHASFVDDFEAMVEDHPERLVESLQSKIAVFYADGNRLGKHRARALAEGGLEGLGRFSSGFKTLQRGLLRDIMAWLNHGAVSEAPAYLTPAGDLRFETLMWGGDEILFVMPAWLAIDFAAAFAGWTAGWKTPAGDPLTFSCGLVIAHHKTPVRQMKGIADALADIGKSLQPQDGGPAFSSRGHLQFEVFESLSLPETGPVDYRKRLHFPAGDPGDAALARLDAQLSAWEGSGEGFPGLVGRVRELAAGERLLPRSQLYRMLREAGRLEENLAPASGVEKAIETMYGTYLSRAGQGKAPPLDALKVLRPDTAFALGDGPVGEPALARSLGAIATLWDYVVPYIVPREDADG